MRKVVDRPAGHQVPWWWWWECHLCMELCGGRAENHCSKTPLGDRWHAETQAQVEGADAQDVRSEIAMLH